MHSHTHAICPGNDLTRDFAEPSPGATDGAQLHLATDLVLSVDPPPASAEETPNARKSAGRKDSAGKAEAVLEASSLLLPRAAEGMKEHLLQSTFLGGVAGSTMSALFRAGQSVPIFGEVPYNNTRARACAHTSARTHVQTYAHAHTPDTHTMKNTLTHSSGLWVACRYQAARRRLRRNRGGAREREHFRLSNDLKCEFLGDISIWINR